MSSAATKCWAVLVEAALAVLPYHLLDCVAVIMVVVTVAAMGETSAVEGVELLMKQVLWELKALALLLVE